MAGYVNGRKINSFFMLVVFCLFTVAAMTALLVSGNFYQKIVDESGESRDEHLALSYIRTKIRHNDVAGQVYICEYFGGNALCLEERIEGVTYRTFIYLYDGWICEWYAEAGYDFAPEAGKPVASAETLVFESWGENGIKVTVNRRSLTISLRAVKRSMFIQDDGETGD